MEISTVFESKSNNTKFRKLRALSLYKIDRVLSQRASQFVAVSLNTLACIDHNDLKVFIPQDVEAQQISVVLPWKMVGNVKDGTLYHQKLEDLVIFRAAYKTKVDDEFAKYTYQGNVSEITKDIVLHCKKLDSNISKKKLTNQHVVSYLWNNIQQYQDQVFKERCLLTKLPIPFTLPTQVDFKNEGFYCLYEDDRLANANVMNSQNMFKIAKTTQGKIIFLLKTIHFKPCKKYDFLTESQKKSFVYCVEHVHGLSYIPSEESHWKCSDIIKILKLYVNRNDIILYKGGCIERQLAEYTTCTMIIYFKNKNGYKQIYDVMTNGLWLSRKAWEFIDKYASVFEQLHLAMQDF